MDLCYVKSTLEGLKSTSSTRVQETLLKIRSKITTNDDGIKLFRESGGLDYLLPHLRKPNERILDIALSILGNCCLEEESSLAVSETNLDSNISLKTVCIFVRFFVLSFIYCIFKTIIKIVIIQ